MKKYNVLVTGVGAIIGYGIINSLRKSNLNLNIIGTDIFDDAYGRNLVDKFYVNVLASSPNYIEHINSIISKEKIDLILPGIEQDLYALYPFKDKINAKIVLNNEICINISKDKLLTYNYFKSNSNINLIPTLFNCSFEECVEKLGLPFILKPRSSYASKGIQKISTKREFEFYTESNLENVIFQKIISTIESEYTIAVFGDGNGSFFDSIILKRKLSKEGATNKATVVENEQIQNYIIEIVQFLKPIGPTNIQIRIENNIPFLLEINPRISSACSIRSFFGYNDPEMCVKHYLLGEKINKKQLKKGSAIRFIDDFITYDE